MVRIRRGPVQRAGMRVTSPIAVCSLYCDVDPLRRVTEPNRIAYCERHGYAYHAEYASMDPLRPPSWTKVLLLLRHLGKYEWVLWLDADAVIVRPERKLEEIADPQAEVVWRMDVNGIN